MADDVCPACYIISCSSSFLLNKRVAHMICRLVTPKMKAYNKISFSTLKFVYVLMQEKCGVLLPENPEFFFFFQLRIVPFYRAY